MVTDDLVFLLGLDLTYPGTTTAETFIDIRSVSRIPSLTKDKESSNSHCEMETAEAPSLPGQGISWNIGLSCVQFVRLIQLLRHPTSLINKLIDAWV